jgi:hypothetical protein
MIFLERDGPGLARLGNTIRASHRNSSGATLSGRLSNPIERKAQAEGPLSGCADNGPARVSAAPVFPVRRLHALSGKPGKMTLVPAGTSMTPAPGCYDPPMISFAMMGHRDSLSSQAR